MDFVVKQALSQMPDGCGVKVAYRANGKLQSMDRSKGATSMELISRLLYADDMVLLSSREDELASMLKGLDKVSAGLGLRMNASKTKIMAIPGHAKGAVVGMEGVEGCRKEVEISEGMVEVVAQLRYLGSMLVNDGKLEVELAARKTKAVVRFRQFEKMWGTRHLFVATKMKCYRAYVLPILLFGSFGSETWSLSQAQSLVLERGHTSCLRSILGVKLSDHHSNAPVRAMCGATTLSTIISTNRLRCLGHVGRMGHGRLPHIALFSTLRG
jgi:hypothetical protein